MENKPIFYVVKDYEELSEKCAEEIIKYAEGKDKITLGTSTGSTFEKTYKLLEGKLFNVSAVQQQDFYAGNMEYQNEIFNRVVSKMPGNPEYRYTYWDGSEDTEQTSIDIHENNWKRTEKEDTIQLLGVGVEGHIGFNEAGDEGTDPKVGVHTLKLSESTIKVNARFYNSIDEVPTKTITSGVYNLIEQTKMILFAASGENKAQAVHDAFFGEVSNACPASFLQLYKGPIVVVLDEKAASKIKDKI